MSKEQVRHRVFKGRKRLETELRQLNQYINGQEKHYHLWGNRSGDKPSFNKWSKFDKSWDNWSNTFQKVK